MRVELLNSTPLAVAEIAARTCTRSSCKCSSTVDFQFLKKLWEKGHHSVFEHLTYSFLITDIPRGLLQQLVRHRFISFSVESTRYSLSRRVDELVANEDLTYDEVDWDKLMGLSVLKRICGNAENDEAKYYVPDWFPTDLVMTTNLRELDHIINIRTRPDAWRPFYDLCHEILKAMPLDHLQVIGLDHLVKVDEYVSRGTGHGLSRAVKSEL